MCLSQATPQYERRNPEQTNLYQIIAQNWNTFCQERSEEGIDLPKYVVDEFEGYLRCGILAHGFGRVHCPTCDEEKLVPFSCKGRGFCPSCGARRMAEEAIYLRDVLIPLVPVRQFVVTFPPPLRLWLARSTALASSVSSKVMAAIEKHLRKNSGVQEGYFGGIIFIQRFGSGANLNVHFHVLVLDGTYDHKSTGRAKFYPAKAPTEETTKALAEDISTRINNHLVKKGYLEKQEDLMLLGNTEDIFSKINDSLHLPAQAASVANQIAFGLNAGKPVRRLKLGSRLWPSEDDVEVSSTACVNVGGYSVHAATAIKSYERERLEKLVRYMSRPAISDERLSVMPDGTIRLKLKTRWKDGTEFLEFTATEFIEKLIALIPIPKFHLTRYYGVFASRSALRNSLPDMPEPASDLNISTDDNEPPRKNLKQKGRRRRCKKPIGWAALLKRTFGIDVLSCQKCASRMTLVGVVFDAKTIAVTLNAIGVSQRAPPIAPARARQQTVFDHVDTCYEYEYVD